MNEELYRRILKEKIAVKYRDWGFNENESNGKASRIVDDMPTELLDNIVEWLNNKPISDIEYGGMSIKKIMNMNNLENNHKAFLSCARAMVLYIKSGCTDKWICTHYFKA